MFRTQWLVWLAGIALVAACQGEPDDPSDPGTLDKSLDNFNALYQGGGAGAAQFVLPDKYKALVHPAFDLQADEAVGLPTFVWASEQASKDAGKSGAPLNSETIAREYLELFAELYRMDAQDLATIELRYVHDTGRGGIIAKFIQKVNGLEVFQHEMSFLMTREDKLVAISGYLSPHAGETGAVSFTIDATDAITRAFKDLTGEELDASGLKRVRENGDISFYQDQNDLNASPRNRISRPTGVQPILFLMADHLEPAYYLELNTLEPARDGSYAHAYVISAADGALLKRANIQLNDHAYRVWAEDSGDHMPWVTQYGDAGFPHPTGDWNDYAEPAFIDPILVTLNHGPISTSDPWLASDATETVGNNTNVFLDLAAPDGFSPDEGDFRATTTAANEFDRTMDLTIAPDASTDQQMAAVTQLFYTVNWLHDWYYDSGFDEISGNAQDDNYGRGGLAGDRMDASAQFYDGRNNAFCSCGADGWSPWMAQFIWDAPAHNVYSVDEPAAIAGDYRAGVPIWGPQVYDVSAEFVLVDDGTDLGTDACEPILNWAEIQNKIAVIDVGYCSVLDAIMNVQAEHAAGVVLVHWLNTAPSWWSSDPGITIPSIVTGRDNGELLKEQLGWSTTVTGRLLAEENTNQDRDSSIDGLVIGHEWGHYLQIRLTANGDVWNNQGGSLSEGHADFNGLMLAVKEGQDTLPGNEDWAGVYPANGYVDGDMYFGIRRYPYSTDMTVNPLTFQHVEDGVPLPEDPPNNGGQDGANNAEVHNSGEFWAVVLWELYASLLNDDDLTFTEAQTLMRDYVVAGLKLTPGWPTFTEERDAILATAYANDPDHFTAFAAAFAKRGLGADAVAPDRNSTDHAGVVESFDPMTPVGGLTFVDATLGPVTSNCDGDDSLDVGETALLTVRLRNSGLVGLSNTTATVTSTDDVAFTSGGVITFPASAVNETVEGTIGVTLQSGTGITDLDLAVTYDDTETTVDPQTEDLVFLANTDSVANQTATDDVEDGLDGWTIVSTVGATSPWRIVETAYPNHAWFGPNANETSDQSIVSPDLVLSATDPFGFTFEHRYSFEYGYFDGGVVELSVWGGSSWGSWQDIGGYADVGYDDYLVSGGTNPLQGRPAYLHASAGYPAFVTETYDLGTALAGQTVRIRFRVGCDLNSISVGWHIDDIAFSGIDNLPFSELIAEPDSCTPAAGVNLDPAGGLITWESGTTDTFRAVLNSAPSGDVTIGLSSGDATEGSVAPASLTFTTADWAIPQTVTVTGVDDDELDGNVDYDIVTAAASSADSTYSGLDAADVSVTNMDDDGACPTGVSGSSITGTATIGGSVTVNLAATDHDSYEVDYNGTTTPLAGSETTYALTGIVADEPTVVVRAIGTGPDQLPCADEAALDLTFAAAAASNLVQTPDSSTTPVALGTEILLTLDTTGASAVTVGGNAMSPTSDPNITESNSWSFTHTAMANETLDVLITTPGNPPVEAAGGSFPISLATGTCPTNVASSAVVGTATIEGSVFVDLAADNEVLWQVEYNGIVYDSFAVYDQVDHFSGGTVPAFTLPAPWDAYDNEAADDFTVPAGETWTIDEIFAPGENAGWPITAVDIVIYDSDAGTVPGTVLYTLAAQPAVDDGYGNVTIELPTPLVLGEGTYWISFAATLEEWYMGTRGAQTGEVATWRNPDNGWGWGLTDWSPAWWLTGEPDLAFSLRGSSSIDRFMLNNIVANEPTVIVRALGTGPDSEPCQDQATLNLTFVAADADNLAQNPDSQPDGVPYDTTIQLSLDTVGASAVTAGGTPMVPAVDPNTNNMNSWTLLHTAQATESLAVEITTPGNPPTTASDGAFAILLEAGECPANVANSTVDDWATIGGSVNITCLGDNVDTYEIDYNGDTFVVGPQHLTMVDQASTPGSSIYTAQNFESGFEIYSAMAADDFTVPAGATWTVDEIFIAGQGPSIPVQALDMVLYAADNGSLPGTEVVDLSGTPVVDDGEGNLTASLAVPVELTEGRYWISFSAVLDFLAGGQWFAIGSTTAEGDMTAWVNPGDGFGTGCTDWAPAVDCIGWPNPGLAFYLGGFVDDGSPPAFTLENIVADEPTVTVRGIGTGPDNNPCDDETTLELTFPDALANTYTQTPNSHPDGINAGTDMTLSLHTVGASMVTVDGNDMTPASDPNTTNSNTWTYAHTAGTTSEALPVLLTTPGATPAVDDATPFYILAVCDVLSCTAIDDCHADGTCDPYAGVCSEVALADGTVCDDSNLCTSSDTCFGGVCLGGDPVICDCVDPGGCNPDTGLCEGTPLADGIACGDGEDACFDGICVDLDAGDTCEGAVELTVGVAYDGDLAETLASMDIPDSCLSGGASGPDAFHIVDLNAGTSYTVTLTPDVNDMALAVLSGCDTDDACLEAADDGAAAEDEVITDLTVTADAELVIQVVDLDYEEPDGGTDGGVDPVEYTLLVEAAADTDTDTDTDTDVDSDTDTDSDTDVDSDTDSDTDADTDTGADAGTGGKSGDGCDCRVGPGQSSQSLFELVLNAL